MPFSLLAPFRLRYEQQLMTWPAPFDPPIPNQPRVPQYPFRRGGFYQPQQQILYPTPFDPPIPNQPLIPQYAFRKGGFYQPQQQILYPVPFDPPIPNQPLQRPYVFRPGGFWQPQRQIVYPIPGGLIAGQTQTVSGAPLPLCTVHLFLTATDQIVATTTSDASANYAFTIANSGGPYYLVAYLPGSPDVAGTTVNTLIPN